MNIENIIKKFNYDETLANFLRELYPEFIAYFGADKEPIIYEALYNTPILIGDNVYQILKNNDMLDNDDGYAVSAADLKRSSGAYQSKAIIDYEDNEFKIKEVKRVVIVTKNYNNGFSKSPLIHELGHLIKSYYNEYKIDNDLLIGRSGLIETKKRLIKDGEKIKEVLIEEKGVGLEEGLNSIMQEEITKKLVDPNFEISGYGVLCHLAKIIVGSDLLSAFLEAEIKDDKESLITKLDEEFIPSAYKRIDKIFDKLYILTLKRFSEIFDKNKFKITTEEIEKLIKEDFNTLIKEINNARALRKGM